MGNKLGVAWGVVRVWFVVDQLALGQVFLRILQFSPFSIIPPTVHISLHLNSTDIVPHNDVSFNDGPHIRRWPCNIIILYYIILYYIILYYIILYYIILYYIVFGMCGDVKRRREIWLLKLKGISFHRLAVHFHSWTTRGYFSKLRTVPDLLSSYVPENPVELKFSKVSFCIWNRKH